MYLTNSRRRGTKQSIMRVKSDGDSGTQKFQLVIYWYLGSISKGGDGLSVMFFSFYIISTYTVRSGGAGARVGLDKIRWSTVRIR